MTRNPQANDSGANGSTDSDERSALLNHAQSHIQRITRTDSGTPYYKHSNPVVRYPSAVLHTTFEVLKTNYVNVLLVFVPLGIIAGAADWSPVLKFVLNFIAIIPLASLLAFATEELAVPLGQTIGGLLNATFGNAVELIVRFPHSSSRAQADHYLRSVSSRSAAARFESSRPACWDLSYLISFSFWVAASSQAASDTVSKLSTRLSRVQCPP